MRYLRHILIAFAFLWPCLLAFTQPPLPTPEAPLTAQAIMARVAAHQDAAEIERSHYVYLQHARVTSHKGKTVLCEETTDSRVTPTGNASRQQLLKLEGRYLLKGHYVTYTQPLKDDDSAEQGIHFSTGDDDSDRVLVEDMRRSFTNNSSHESKDGFDADLFPLTTRSLQNEDFTLLARERLNHRDVFHITFRPKDKSDFNWKGDAFIDCTAFQPVLVHTSLSRNIPFAVRALLGTSVPGLGFSIAYAPQADGVWFPTSFGTEFKIKVLFFFHRTVTVSVENHSFEKTHVTSTILDAISSSGDPTPPNGETTTAEPTPNSSPTSKPTPQ